MLLQLLVSPENKVGLFIFRNIFWLQLVLKLYILDLGYVGKMNIRITGRILRFV